MSGLAVVTGASSGLGLEIARLLARRGYALALAARGRDRLDAIAAELRRAHGVDAEVVVVDLAAPAGAARLTAALAGREVEILVNNAGFGASGPFAETDPDTIRQMIQVNVTAPTELARALLPPMLARGRGRIMNVASTAAFQPGPYMATYYATKAYLLSLSEAIAAEVDRTGVTVTTLCPGPTATGFAARAGMESSNLFRFGLVMDAAAVAKAGVEGMLRGERLVIPGVVNKVQVQSLRVSPRRMVSRIAAGLNRGRAGK